MASPGKKTDFMTQFVSSMQSVRTVFLVVTETGAAIVGAIVLIYILLGEAAGPYVLSVVTNLVLLIGAITAPALVGIALVVGLIYLIKTRQS